MAFKRNRRTSGRGAAPSPTPKFLLLKYNSYAGDVMVFNVIDPITGTILSVLDAAQVTGELITTEIIDYTSGERIAPLSVEVSFTGISDLAVKWAFPALPAGNYGFVLQPWDKSVRGQYGAWLAPTFYAFLVV